MKTLFNTMQKGAERSKWIHRTEDGFSLLELVVAVAVVLIIAVLGVVGYGAIQSNARDAAVEAAAGEVYTGVSAERHAPRGKSAEQVVTEYNASSDGITTAVSQGEDDVCVEAIYTSRPKHTAQRGDCMTTDNGDPDGNNNGDDQNNGGDNNGDEDYGHGGGEEQLVIYAELNLPIHERGEEVGVARLIYEGTDQEFLNSSAKATFDIGSATILEDHLDRLLPIILEEYKVLQPIAAQAVRHEGEDAFYQAVADIEDIDIRVRELPDVFIAIPEVEEFYADFVWTIE